MRLLTQVRKYALNIFYSKTRKIFGTSSLTFDGFYNPIFVICGIPYIHFHTLYKIFYNFSRLYDMKDIMFDL